MAVDFNLRVSVRRLRRVVCEVMPGAEDPGPTPTAECRMDEPLACGWREVGPPSALWVWGEDVSPKGRGAGQSRGG